jgi:hypothetical protein
MGGFFYFVPWLMHFEWFYPKSGQDFFLLAHPGFSVWEQHGNCFRLMGGLLQIW